MNTKKPVVSQVFAALYDLYCSELEQMGRDGQGEECQQALLAEVQSRRDNPAFYMQLAKDHPEFSAVMFYGAFEFLANATKKTIKKVIRSDMTNLPHLSKLLCEISFTANTHTVVNLVSGMPDGIRIITIAIGLEYLRFVGWGPDDVAVETDDDPNDDGDEDEWPDGQAPQVIGLDEGIGT